MGVLEDLQRAVGEINDKVAPSVVGWVAWFCNTCGRTSDRLSLSILWKRNWRSLCRSAWAWALVSVCQREHSPG